MGMAGVKMGLLIWNNFQDWVCFLLTGSLFSPLLSLAFSQNRNNVYKSKPINQQCLFYTNTNSVCLTHTQTHTHTDTNTISHSLTHTHTHTQK